MTYFQRAQQVKNPTAKKLLELMERKKTNLCASVDLTKATEFLHLVEKIGPEICLLKTHIDTLEDFNKDFIKKIVTLANKHKFLIFEDRKFADIGNTVRLQYEKGIYNIVDWSDITNAHLVPGPGIIEGLKKIGLPKKRGLLLLAEMSSEGSLATGDYTKKAYAWAKEHDDFVIGFIGKGHTNIPKQMITMTPGVNLKISGDGLGQQYQTPKQAIHNGTDIIIVGRGIYKADNPLKIAKQYRQAAWSAYMTRGKK